MYLRYYYSGSIISRMFLSQIQIDEMISDMNPHDNRLLRLPRVTRLKCECHTHYYNTSSDHYTIMVLT